MTQMWHGLVDNIRLLPTVNPADDRFRDPVQLQGERANLDEALEKISILLALKQRESIAPEVLGAHTPGVSTPISTGGATKRKRRPSVSSSPVPVAPSAPHTGGSMESKLTSIASPLQRSGTPGSRDLIGKQKKEVAVDQLQLQPGRKVAFKVPVTKDLREKSGDDESGECDWILATIVKHISHDKISRYEVQDADDPTK